MMAAALRQRVQHYLPQLPARITRYTPAPVMELLLTQGLNHVLQAECRAGELEFLRRRIARVEITDLNFSFSLTFNGQRLQALLPAQPSEVMLRSDQYSLLQILHGDADPDTLFFRRKLLITGDTELGLYLKNMIDTVPLTQRIPAPVMRLLIHIYQSRKAEK